MHHLIGILVFVGCLAAIALLVGIAWLSLESPALATAAVFVAAGSLVGVAWAKRVRSKP